MTGVKYNDKQKMHESFKENMMQELQTLPFVKKNMTQPLMQDAN